MKLNYRIWLCINCKDICTVTGGDEKPGDENHCQGYGYCSYIELAPKKTKKKKAKR